MLVGARPRCQDRAAGAHVRATLSRMEGPAESLAVLALFAALSRQRVRLGGRNVLLVSERPAAWRERLSELGARVTSVAPIEAGVGAGGGAFDFVVWMERGLDPTDDARWDRALDRLAAAVAPGAWRARLAATGSGRPWSDWETALVARGP